MFIIWNFETDKFRSGHRVFKANWVLESIVGKNFRTVPYFIMHAHLINYAFYPLSLNTIDNSLGNWIYTSLIITYRTNKRGFFSQRFFLRCFFLSLSLHFHLFLFPISLAGILPSRPLSVYFFFFFLRYLQGLNSQFSIVFVRLAVCPLYHCSTSASCR